MRKTAFVASVVLILGLAGLIQIAGARQGGEESPHQYVVVCHRTFGVHPFVLIVVAEESTQLGVQPKGGGHKVSGEPGHQGDFFVPGFDPTTDHQAALAFAKAHRFDSSVCVAAAPPAPPQAGVAPVTG